MTEFVYILVILFAVTVTASLAAFIYPSFFGGLKRDFVAWLSFLLSCKSREAFIGLLFSTAAGDMLLGGDHLTADVILIIASGIAAFAHFVAKRKGFCERR